MAMAAETNLAERLCLACGLCCSGVLFRDVELQAGDDSARLQALGLPLERLKRRTRFPQPCAALCEGNQCRLYQERPARCRQFECALFKAVLEQRVKTAAALKTIQQARRAVDRVRALLRQLGDLDEQLALSRRFRRMQRRLESGGANRETAGVFADLSSAMHELNLLLREKFLP